MKNNKKSFRSNKFQKQKFDSSGKKERPFEKFIKKKFAGKKSFEKKENTLGKYRKKPFRKWEKPSVYFKKKRAELSKQKNQETQLVRLNKYIANAGICSRRDADKLIENGLISVNGKIVTELGTKIHPDDVVKYAGETLKKEKNVYVLLNKPKDYITTVEDTHQRKTVMDLVRNCCKERIYPVGRLDRNTTGVLLFTNDGELAKKLTHPKHGAKKIYHVETDKNVAHEDLKKLTEGITLEDGIAKADEAHYGESKNQIGISLHSGKNRIVRRMLEALGYNVVKLDRVSFAGLTKKNLERGRWRFLTEKEIGFLKMI